MGVGMKTKKRGTNTKTSAAKQKARERFLNRHIDQVRGIDADKDTSYSPSMWRLMAFSGGNLLAIAGGLFLYVWKQLGKKHVP